MCEACCRSRSVNFCAAVFDYILVCACYRIPCQLNLLVACSCPDIGRSNSLRAGNRRYLCRRSAPYAANSCEYSVSIRCAIGKTSVGEAVCSCLSEYCCSTILYDVLVCSGYFIPCQRYLLVACCCLKASNRNRCTLSCIRLDARALRVLCVSVIPCS